MDCVCEVDVDDFGEESKTIVHNVRPSDGKVTCSECGKLIKAGEDYEYYKGSAYESVFVNRTCITCLSIRSVFFTSGYVYEQLMDNFREFVEMHEGQISEDCISKLIPSAKDVMFKMIEEIWMEAYLDQPTTPAFRTHQMMLTYSFWKRPPWMNERMREMAKMDKFVIRNSISK